MTLKSHFLYLPATALARRAGHRVSGQTGGSQSGIILYYPYILKSLPLGALKRAVRRPGVMETAARAFANCLRYRPGFRLKSLAAFIRASLEGGSEINYGPSIFKSDNVGFFRAGTDR